jgi:hypothetical protein
LIYHERRHLDPRTATGADLDYIADSLIWLDPRRPGEDDDSFRRRVLAEYNRRTGEDPEQ